MTFFHCFDCRKQALSGSAVRLWARLAAKSKRARNESDDCLALLKTFCFLLKVQPAAYAPRSCTLSAPSSKCARLRRTFHFLFPPPSLLPFPPHAAASRCGAANFSSFIFEKKSENAAARNTHRSTRIAQHDLCSTTRVT